MWQKIRTVLAAISFVGIVLILTSVCFGWGPFAQGKFLIAWSAVMLVVAVDGILRDPLFPSARRWASPH